MWLLPGIGAGSPAALTNVSQVVALDRPSAMQALPVNAAATITYCDPNLKMLFLQDGASALYAEISAEAASNNPHLQPGQSVTFEGQTRQGLNLPYIWIEKITAGSAASLPAALDLTDERNFGGTGDCRWAKAKGWLSGVSLDRSLFLDLNVQPTQSVTLILPREISLAAAAPLVGSLVEAEGVLSARAAGGKTTGDPVLWVQSLDFVHPLQQLPVVSIDSLQKITDPKPTQPARIAGTVTSHELLDVLRVRDPSGEVLVHSQKPVSAHEGDAVEILGYPEREEGTVVLKGATVEARPTLVPGAPPPSTAGSNLPSTLLVRVAQVMDLTPQEAAQRHAVRANGVLTFYDPAYSLYFLQDESGGIYLDLSYAKQEGDLQAGERVEVIGLTGAGRYSPVIAAQSIRVTGPASMPKPDSVTPGMMINGSKDAQWVSLSGIVHTQTLVEDHYFLSLGTGDSTITVILPDAQHQPAPRDFVGCLVVVEGVCSVLASDQHRVLDSSINVPSWKQVELEEASSADLSSLPVRQIAGLFAVHPGSTIQNRSRVQGTVTLCKPSGDFFMQDETGGICVSPVSSNALVPGMTVDAVGFSALPGGLPTLQDAAVGWLSSKSNSLPKPIQLDPAAPVNENLQGVLVQFRGRVLRDSIRASEQILTLAVGEWITDAVLPIGKEPAQVANFAPETVVELTGIFVIRPAKGKSPASFYILLGSGKDVRVVTRPSWWTRGHVCYVLATLGAVLLLALAWIGLLRKEVRDHTAKLRAEIEERKHAEQSRARLATAVEQSAEAIVVTDAQAVIQYVNPAFERVTGYTRAESAGQNPRLLKSGRHGPELYKSMWARLTEGKAWSGQLTNRRKNGSLYDSECSITPVHGQEGKIINFVAVSRDVTYQRSIEEQLRQSQKLEAIGTLAGGVAHDFNNILSSLLMQTDVIGMIDPLPAEVREGLQQIAADTRRAADLTRQLLLFSRRQVMQPRLLNLNDLVINLAKMLQRIIREDVHLHLHLHTTALLTRGDPGMLEQVLMNLAVNARDAMPGGGELQVATTETMVDEDAAQLNPDASPGRYVGFSVGDTGSGIPPEVLPKIFEPFFTTKGVGKGTGLGLATVFGIVKQHQGWVKVDNRPGEGVTFQIFLPASMVTEMEPAQAVAKPKPRGGSETILLVEDEEAVRKSTRKLLERYGYQVLEAPNGIEALKCWEENDKAVSLLLTDLVMPAGVSGQELARQLVARQPELKVIYASGYSVDIAGRDFQLRQGEAFVQKPCPTVQLMETVRKCLDD
ncbi:MAG: PAS domain S-box protein [Verrucomicrobiota bacterium]